MIRNLCLLFLCTTASITHLRGQGLLLTFEIAPSTVNVGSSFWGEIKISGLNANSAPALGGFDLDLAFDAGRVSYGSTVFGDPLLGNQLDQSGFGTLAIATSLPGVINLFELSFDAPTDLEAGQGDAFVLATLLFHATDSGWANFHLSVNGLADAYGTSLPAQVFSDSAQIIGLNTGPIPEPSTYAAAAVALATLVVLRRRFRSNNSRLPLKSNPSSATPV